MSFGKRRFIPKSTLEKILGIIFAVMLIGVGILTYFAIQKRNNQEIPNYDQVIPFMTEATNSVVEIDVSGMQYGDMKEYIFKVTNYKDKTIIKNELDYGIYFITDDLDLSLELYKNNDDIDLLEGNEEKYVRNQELRANKKQEDYYRLVITANESIENEEKVILQIFSE